MEEILGMRCLRTSKGWEWDTQAEGGVGTETRNRCGLSQGGDKSEHSVRNSGSGHKNINCRSRCGYRGNSEREKAALSGSGGAGEPAGAPGLGKGEAKARGFMLPTMISFCRRADVLQPRPIPSLEHLPVALGTHLSVF